MAGELNMEGHPGSLHELEQLLSMDGIPHERVPTDDFFADYLHGLSTLAARQAESNNTNSGCSGPGLSASCAQPTASTAVPAAAAFSGGLHTGLASGSFVTGGSMVSGANGMAPLAFAPSVAAAAGGWSFPHGGLVALHGQPGMMAAAPAVLPLLGMVGMVSKACKEGKAAGRNGGKPARLNQRQATNREAQKRYRERQKARLLEMQVTIDRLHRELAQRRGVQGRNQRLEELHCRLQAQLAQAECEVEQLQWQAAQAKRESRQLAHHASSVDNARAADIDGGAPTDGPMAPTAGTAEQQGEAAWGSPEHAQRQASLASSAAGSAVGASAGGGVATAAECTRVGPQHTGTLDGHQPCSTGAAQQGVYSGSGQAPRRNDTLPLGAEEAAELAAAAVADPLAGMYGPPPPHEAFDSLLSRFQAQVARVKGFLEEHGLRLCDPSAATLPPTLRGQILVLVQESLGICRDLLRVEGVDVIELLQRQDEEAMASSGALTGSMLRQKWLHVIQVLHLTGEQRQQLLLQRSAHLALMARIYRQRQQLNMQAMSLMLLPGGGAASGGSPSAADCRAASGGQAAKLAVVLRLVKENLRREQRAAMEINACTLSRILTPIQAALYVCEAFPLHCDALGMCNALSTLGATSGKTGSAAGSAGTPRHSVTSPASSMG